jgi:hypothetical protein
MPRRPSAVSDEHIERIKAYKLEGKTWAEVAKLVNLSEHQCRHQLHKLGFKPLHPCKFAGYSQTERMSRAETEAKLIPRGSPTLPPLPCLLEPIHIIQNR